ncbi:DUF91 domain-containing protein [Rhizobium sophorae]|nr:endonuclease NucS domain-containing protein [Rhizobium sp. C104]ANL30113.1 restriction endonuclease-like protein [Rhizobium phaseoli]MBB4388261.1 hypothetical protein [Rhizobium leguminosarum]NNU41143.1 DUF91 domain-containing protein [Rhizobium sophorae]OWO92922.1 hypothetical protein B5E41_21065 [Rhizobium esperanzae]PCK84495.1 DUF91 domain-containing protein [Rhizobium sophoriradicis]PDS75345.1 DUF91 domain-containing protein [Rhizobium sp. L43]
MSGVNEDQIRDYLIDNLDLVEPNLKFLGKEHHLRNPNGSDGFLDIFAVAPGGEYVIIEIKRTRSASRDAVHELIKYAALLRHKLLVKEREYRFILLSVDWVDLHVPFSEWMRNCPYDVSAGRIVLGQNKLPARIEKVVSNPRVLNRRIARRHYMWRFGSQPDIDRAIKLIAKHMNTSGVEDFILIFSKIPADDMHYLYFAQQQNSKEFYLNDLERRLSRAAFREVKDDVEGHVLQIDQEAVAADRMYEPGFELVHSRLRSISSTISYPERAGEWFTPDRISEAEIRRYGRFIDVSMTDAELIKELVVTDSFNDLDIVATTESNAQMGELAASVKRALQFNNEWHATLRELFEYASAGGPAVIRLQIYSNDDILRVLAAEYYEASLYTPALQCEIEFVTRREVFQGFLEWDGAPVDVRSVIRRHFGDHARDYASEKFWGSHRPRNMDVMSDLGLRYSIGKTSERSFHRVRLQGKEMVVQSAKEGLPDFVTYAQEAVAELAQFFDETDTGFENAIAGYHYQKIVQAEAFLKQVISATRATKTDKFWLGQLPAGCDYCGRPFAHLRYMADGSFKREPSGNWCAACLVDKTRSSGGFTGEIYFATSKGWQLVETDQFSAVIA